MAMHVLSMALITFDATGCYMGGSVPHCWHSWTEGLLAQHRLVCQPSLEEVLVAGNPNVVGTCTGMAGQTRDSARLSNTGCCLVQSSSRTTRENLTRLRTQSSSYTRTFLPCPPIVPMPVSVTTGPTSVEVFAR